MNWQKLSEIVEPDQIVAPEENHRYRLGELPPFPIVYPRSEADISKILRFAVAEQVAIITVGGATKLEIGNNPARAALFLSTLKLNEVLEHPAADLTVTVQAGCTLQALQQAVGGHGQFLPLDAPYCERATIGGIVATNSYGPLRLAAGQVRDWLIGIKVVTTDGEISKAGGKVVKNVAGYDLMKLYTGSFGSLAVITELNFKLRPLPAVSVSVVGRFNDLPAINEAVQKVMGSQLLPASLELMTTQAGEIVFPGLGKGKGDYLLAVKFSGTTAAVEHQCAKVVSWWRSAKPTVIKDQVAAQWQRVADFADHYPHMIALRVAVLPSRLMVLLDEMREWLVSISRDYQLLSHVGNGVARIFINGEDGEIKPNLRPRWRVAIEGIRTLSRREGGSTVVERAPATLKEVIDCWGEPASGLELMRLIKRKFDKDNILNPGRFVGGI